MPSIMAKPRNQNKPTKQKINQSQKLEPQRPEKPPSWAVVRGLLTCKHSSQTQKQNEQQQQQQQQQMKQKQKPKQKQKLQQKQEQTADNETAKKCKKMKCSGLLCSNTKVMHRPEISFSPEVHKKRASSSISSSNSSSGAANNNEGTNRSMKAPPNELNAVVSSSSSLSSSSLSLSSSATSSSLTGGSFRGMPFRRFSGCYECRMVVDPVLGFARDPSLRSSICSCPECGEIFMKPEYLELHQTVRHAVSELGPEDTSKNIVEIIFQSSWLKKQTPVCKIDRILKVHNTQKTISRFEEYRDAIKAKATKLPKKNPRCVADGNELLRFHCATFQCSLGLNGSSNLCNSVPTCSICSIIKNGFKVAGDGILTTATSGKAHDSVVDAGGGCEARAMLVCRVIAGRVKKSMEGGLEEYDSGAGEVGVYSNLDELYVFNPRAILPCFVVIYRGF